jgi:hypothetical protein
MSLHKVVFLGIITLLYLNGAAQEKSLLNNMRSDTINVLDYQIELNFLDIANENMVAKSRVKFEAKMNGVSSISLDLLAFTIDSVKQGQQQISYSYNDTLLVANFISAIDEGDIDSVTVFYRGTPQTDPSGLGGFYFMGGGAFNFGVGLTAQPHNYGRVWHPCFDNFVERATYDMTFITPSQLSAYSAGLIEEESIDGNGNNVRRWIMEDPIQSYLMGFAIYDYTHVSDTYTSISGDEIPIMLVARPQDTTGIKSSFINLKNALAAYEDAYGPYVWDKVGYFFVPFSSAAMEHATGVIYPQAIATGNLQFETIMAHELSHHWWGNLLTCKTASDMWINEAFATYSEPLFLEYVYAYENYLSSLRSTHRQVIQQAHFDDGAFLPLSGVPASATYGTHTYRKGATVVHNLRTYLGDNLFFSGIKDLFENHAFSSMDAEEFKNALSNYTSFNLDAFFEGWILNPGYPGFNIDSFTVENTGADYAIELFVKQRLHQAPNFFENVPMEVTIVDEDMNEFSTNIIVDGENTVATINSPIEPSMIYLNKNDGVFNAVTGENRMYTSSGFQNLNYAYCRVNVQNPGDSSLVRVEHHRTAPEPFENPALSYQFVLSTERFWRVDGIWDEDFEAYAHFNFDARNNAQGNLDSALMVDHGSVVFHEDSIVLLWREGSGYEWKLVDDFTISTFGNPSDGYGRIQANNIKKGEYTFGVRVNIANTENHAANAPIQIFPNPTSSVLNIKTSGVSGKLSFTIYDALGQRVQSGQLNNQKVDVSQLKNGLYFITIAEKGIPVTSSKFIIEK